LAIRARTVDVVNTILFRCGRENCGAQVARLIPVERGRTHLVEMRAGFVQREDGLLVLSRRAEKQWRLAQQQRVIWDRSPRDRGGPIGSELDDVHVVETFIPEGRKRLRVAPRPRDTGTNVNEISGRFGRIDPTRPNLVMDAGSERTSPRRQLLPAEPFRFRCPVCGFINLATPPTCGPDCPCRRLDL
jgi:hypothetical protein